MVAAGAVVVVAAAGVGADAVGVDADAADDVVAAAFESVNHRLEEHVTTVKVSNSGAATENQIIRNKKTNAPEESF